MYYLAGQYAVVHSIPGIFHAIHYNLKIFSWEVYELKITPHDYILHDYNYNLTDYCITVPVLLYKTGHFYRKLLRTLKIYM